MKAKNAHNYQIHPNRAPSSSSRPLDTNLIPHPHMSVETPTPEVLQNGVAHVNLDEKLDPGLSAQKRASESTPKPAPRKLPFESPTASSERPGPVQLSPEEQTKYDDVVAHMKSLESLPTTSNKKNKQTAPLSDLERYFLTKDCMLRYLRATKWNVHEAKKRLEGTVVWRREYGTDTRTAETIEPEVSFCNRKRTDKG